MELSNDDDVAQHQPSPTHDDHNAVSNYGNECIECSRRGDNDRSKVATVTTAPVMAQNQIGDARAELSGGRDLSSWCTTNVSTVHGAGANDVAEGKHDNNRDNRAADTATSPSHQSQRRFSENGRLAERLHEIDELCASLKRRCSTLEWQRNQVENELARVRDVYETQLLKLPKKDDFSESLRDRVVQLERQRQHDRQLLKKQDAETKALRLEVKSQTELIESMRLHREHLEREIQTLEHTLELTSHVQAVPETSNSNSVHDARSLESCVPPPSMVLADGRAYLGSRRDGSSGDEPRAKSELIRKIPPQSSSSSNSIIASQPAHPGSSLPSLHSPLAVQMSPTASGRVVAADPPQSHKADGHINSGAEKRMTPPSIAVIAPEATLDAVPQPATLIETLIAGTTSASHSPARNKTVPLKTNAAPKVHPVPRREGNGAQEMPRSFGGYSPMYGIGALASPTFSPMRGMSNLVSSPAFSPRAPQTYAANLTNGSSSAPTAVAAHVVAAPNGADAAASPTHLLPSSPYFHPLDPVHAAVNSADADSQIAHLESLITMLQEEQQLMREKQVMEGKSAVHSHNQQTGASQMHNYETVQEMHQQAGSAMNEGATSNQQRYASSGDDAGGKADLMEVVSISQFIQPFLRNAESGEPVGDDVVTTATDKPPATLRTINPKQPVEKSLLASSPLTSAACTTGTGMNLHNTTLQHSARKVTCKMNPTPKVHPKTPSKQQDGVLGTHHSFGGICSPLRGTGVLVPSPFTPRDFAHVSSPRAQQRHTCKPGMAPTAVAAAHAVLTTPLPSTPSFLLTVPSLLRLESLHASSLADAEAQIAHLKSLVMTLTHEKEVMLAREKESMLKEAATIREKALLGKREEANAGTVLQRQNWAFQTRPEIQVMPLVLPRPPGLHNQPCSPTKQAAPVQVSPTQPTIPSHFFQTARNSTPINTSRLSPLPSHLSAGTTAVLMNDSRGKKCSVNCWNAPAPQLGLPCPSPPTPAPTSPLRAAGKLVNSAWVFPMTMAHVPHSPRA